GEDWPSDDWALWQVYAYDTTGNGAVIHNGDISTAYEPYTDLSAFDFTVSGTTVDLEAPVIDLSSINLNFPDGKNLTVGGKINCSVAVSDNVSVSYVDMSLRNKGSVYRTQTVELAFNSESGKWEGTATVGEDWPSDDWALWQVYAYDTNGNGAAIHNEDLGTAYEPYTDLSAFDFTVSGTTVDLEPPVIDVDSISVTCPKSSRKLIIGESLSCSVAVSDNVSISNVVMTFRNKSLSDSTRNAELAYNSESGKWEGTATVGEDWPSGNWALWQVYAYDTSGNGASIHNEDLGTAYEPYTDLSAFDFTVAETCKITFDTRGGTPVAPIYVEKGTKAKAPDYPEKEGFTFGSWYKNADLTGYFSFSYYTVDEDMTLYAGWSIMLSVSNWNKTASEEGTGGGYVMGSVGWYTTGCSNISLDESGETLRLTAIPDTGYVFTGWYKGVYTGGSSGQSAEPLDLDNPGTLVSTQPSFDFTVDKYSVIIAVFEECTNHDWVQRIEKAMPTEDGAVYQKCSICNKEEFVAKIPKADIYKLSQSAFTYSGSACKPIVTVARTGEALDKSQYDVTYKNNTNAGTATALVTFKGDYYEGTKALTFKINKAANTLSAKGKKPSVKAAKLKKKNQTVKRAKALAVRNAQGAVTYKKTKGNKKITVAKNGKITVKKGLKKGAYKVKIKVTAAGNSNYNKATKTVTVTIKVK
ncbi:MAG: InlB B-repeat-containing protein, partial [Eubacterium sp.]|nr:InlB B-repeat-containing protein [Eubacterium sp.]